MKKSRLTYATYATLLALCLTGCVTVQPNVEPVHAFRGIPLIPQDWYRTAYEEMEACMGMKGNYDALEFLVVRDGRMGEYEGIWSQKNRIFIAEGFEFHGPLLKHEFGHHIAQELHPGPDALLAKCGVLTIP